MFAQGGQLLCRYHGALTENHGALDDVLQLADVAWPGVTLEQPHGFLGHAQHLLAQLLAIAPEGVYGQRDDIFLALPQWWQGDGVDVEAVEQVAAKFPLRYELLQVL